MDDPLQAIPSGWNPPSGTRRRQEDQEERREVHLSGWDIIQTRVYAPYFHTLGIDILGPFPLAI